MIAYTGTSDADDDGTTTSFQFGIRRTDTATNVDTVSLIDEIMHLASRVGVVWPIPDLPEKRLMFRHWLTDLIHEWPRPRILRIRIVDNRCRTRLLACRMTTRRDMKHEIKRPG